ncbi:MAG: PIN domain-containing protein [Dissulfurispiraceae bacterium]|jgi:predicted nucleic acid-binding protein
MTFNRLQHGDRIFIDANIFIYNFSARSPECRELLLRCAKDDLVGHTLTSVLAEVLHKLMIAEAIEKGHINEKNPLKKLRENPGIIKQLTTYIKNVEKISEMNIRIIALTDGLIKKSAKIRSAEGLLTNDSLVVAALKDLNLVNLATNDNDFDNIKWLSVFKPSDLQSS